MVKNVKITVKKDGTVDCKPSRVNISKKNLEGVCWECSEGEATIQFVKDSPFCSDHFVVPEGGSVNSGPAYQGEPGVIYKYSIVVNIPGDRRQYVLDPEVEVDP